MLHNKKAVAGETLVWVVATIIIVVILVFSIFVTSILIQGKNLGGGDKEFSVSKETDLLITKSVTGYLLTPNSSGEKVLDQIIAFRELDLDEFNLPLSVKIFRELHSRDYFITLDVRGNAAKVVARSGDYPYDVSSAIFDERIYLAEGLDLAVYFNYRKNEN